MVKILKMCVSPRSVFRSVDAGIAQYTLYGAILNLGFKGIV
jgi:hypothetical protein